LDVLQARIKPYQDRIDDRLALFVGTTTTSTIWTAEFELTPGAPSGAVGPLTLFTLDKKKGVCIGSEPSSPSGDGVGQVRLLNPFKDDSTGGGATTVCGPVNIVVQLALSAPDSASMGGVVNVPPGEDKTHGFFYRLPGMATAVIQGSTSRCEPPKDPPDKCKADPPDPALIKTVPLQLARLHTAIAQYGKIAWLPVSTNGRRTQYTLDLSPTTGAMKNFIVASDAVLDKSMVDTLSGAATTVIGAERQKQKAAKDAAASKEVDDLKSQGDVLDQQKRILQLQQDIEKLKKDQSTPQ
jgi:hypothetical protein